MENSTLSDETAVKLDARKSRLKGCAPIFDFQYTSTCDCFVNVSNI